MPQDTAKAAGQKAAFLSQPQAPAWFWHPPRLLSPPPTPTLPLCSPTPPALKLPSSYCLQLSAHTAPLAHTAPPIHPPHPSSLSFSSFLRNPSETGPCSATFRGLHFPANVPCNPPERVSGSRTREGVGRHTAFPQADGQGLVENPPTPGNQTEGIRKVDNARLLTTYPRLPHPSCPAARPWRLLCWPVLRDRS